MYLSKQRGEHSSRGRFLYKFLTGDAIFNDNVKHFWKISEIIFSS